MDKTNVSQEVFVKEVNEKEMVVKVEIEKSPRDENDQMKVRIHGILEIKLL